MNRQPGGTLSQPGNVLAPGIVGSRNNPGSRAASALKDTSQPGNPQIICARRVEVIASMAPPAIPRGIIVERGVVVGGLMVCGSFLLAALLNRSAMEEVPAPAPVAPVTVVAPVVAPASQLEIAPALTDCADAEAPGTTPPSVTETEQSAPACRDSG
jgi:hypothetical protein